MGKSETKIMVALTASYYDQSAVKELLSQCDLIYTTQVRNRDVLEAMFSHVRFIPDSCQDTIAFLKSRHPNATFVEFSDVHRLAYQNSNSER